MSTVSKILVVVILVLVAGSSFLQIAAFSTKANYRAMWSTAVKQAGDAKAASQAELDARNTTISELNQQLTTVVADKTGLATRVEELTKSVQDAEARAQRQETLAKEKEDGLAALQEKVDNMIREIESLNEKMRRDAQELLEVKRDYERVVNSVTALRDKNNSLMLSLTNTRKQLEQALADNEKLNHTLRKYAATEKKEIEITKPKKVIRAHVLAANNDAGVVLLSVGKDDLVEIGHEFIIHRGDVYVCKVRVESVYPDSCVARVIGETLVNDTAVVNTGDNAFTN
jgi:peptidoglycan hydrolase CwlO-like protein